MTRRLLLIAPLLACAPAARPAASSAAAPAAAAAAAPTAEAREVLQVMDRLFDAMRTRDTATLRSLFVPEARLLRLVEREGARTVESLPIDRFIAAVGRAQEEWLERGFTPEVRVDGGTLATIWVEYDFHLGGRFSHCGVDALQLLRTGAGWQIVALADTFRREGCPQRQPPR